VRANLMAALRTRLQRYVEGGDPRGVLDEQALVEAVQLHSLARPTDPGGGGIVDSEALNVVGGFYLAQAQALDKEQRLDESEIAYKTGLNVFAFLHGINPYLVPPTVRNLLDRAPGYPLGERGIELVRQFQRTGRLADLNLAVASFRHALGMTRLDSPARGVAWCRLGIALNARYERTGELSDLDSAVVSFRCALDATPANHPDRAVTLACLCASLRTRFERLGDAADLDRAIAAGHEAVAGTPVGHPSRGAAFSHLGAILAARFERTSNLRDLDEAVAFDREAVAIDREAVAAGAATDPNRGSWLSNLGDHLRARFERTGALTDLDEAIDVGRKAVDATPAGHVNRGAYLSNLSLVLLFQYEFTGDLADLDEAIDVGRKAVDATPAGHVNRGNFLSNLGGALQARFMRTGQEADLDEAIDVGRKAVDATPAGHPIIRSKHLPNLAAAHWRRFLRAGQRHDLDKAVYLMLEAEATTPADSPHRGMCLFNLGLTLHTRFERTGNMADLDKAIKAIRQAAAVIPTDHREHAKCLSGLSAALRIRSQSSGDLADLDEAIEVGREAVEMTSAEHPYRAVCLAIVANALQGRFEQTGRRADRDEALSLWRSAAGIMSAPVGVRVKAARAWGELAADAANHRLAFEGFATAVQLLPRLAWRGVDRATQEYHLAELAGLAVDAAACALEIDQPERAVELLEQGRSILWAQALQTHSDLSGLAEADPELAKRLDKVRRVLDSPATGADLAVRATGLGTAEGDWLDQRSAADARARDDRARLARQWDDIVERVHQMPGFEHFLAPTPFIELRQASAGTVVIVNISRYRCDALAVNTSGVRVTPLVGLTTSDLIQHVAAFVGAIDTLCSPPPGHEPDAPRRILDARNTVTEALAWMWRTIAEPILTNLGLTERPASRAATPRLWWCPTGLLTFLPLHAAGRHTSRNQTQPATVCDRVISSYTPTLSALIEARQFPASEPARTGGPLIVALPETPGQPNLPPAGREAANLVNRFSDAQLLAGPAATAAAVLDALGHRPWAHLACHAAQDISAPSEGGLILHDRLLTVREIAARHPTTAELAFLSACETSRGGVQLADEAITIASALQLAGYRHIIGTLWSAHDSVGPVLADCVYRELTRPRPGHLDTRTTAYALHTAVLTLRDRLPLEPQVWAPYVHIGP
jgi:tetratricopeptide (TPR) repeat protein